MYSVSTYEMTQALDFHFLSDLPVLFAWAGLSAWALAFTGFLVSLWRKPALPK